MVCFGIECCSLVRGGREILDADTVLDKPFIYRLCRVGHEHTAAKVGLREYIGEGRCMVEMETGTVIG